MADPKAPTLGDARKAAEAIARARPDVALVMLFGSVARGEATEDSDIDLAVVLNDLGDYRDRRHIQHQLGQTAARAAACSVDVYLSDLPEWRVRTERVSSSMEAGLAPDLFPLIDQPPARPPDWGKPMKRPADNPAEAAAWFRDVGIHLRKLAVRLLPDQFELGADSPDEAEAYRRNRRVEVCGHAADAAEVAVKALIALGGVSSPKIHDLAELAALVEPRSVRAEIAEIVRSSSVPVAAASAWHVAAGYSNDIDRKWADAEAQAAGMVQLAHDCSVCAGRAFRRAVGGARPDLSKTVDDALALLRRDGPRLTGVEIASSD